MKYKNLKTGTIIDISSELSGGDWERVDAPMAPKNNEAVEKKVDKTVKEQPKGLKRKVVKK